MTLPQATKDLLGRTAAIDFDGEDARKASYITDQLQRGHDGDTRPPREDGDVSMLTETLMRIERGHKRSEEGSKR